MGFPGLTLELPIRLSAAMVARSRLAPDARKPPLIEGFLFYMWSLVPTLLLDWYLVSAAPDRVQLRFQADHERSQDDVRPYLNASRNPLLS